MDIHNGYELINRVLVEGQNDLTQFLREQSGRETSEVEFKASFLPNEPDASSDYKSELIWNILSDIIAIANSSGGCVLFGVKDDGSYADGFLHGLSLDEYKRKLSSKLFESREWAFRKVKYMLDERQSLELRKNCEIIEAKAYDRTILVVLIRPVEKPILCFKCPREQGNEFKKEILVHRGENDDTARKVVIESHDEMDVYLKNRNIKSTRFQDKFDRIFPQSKTRLLRYAMCLLILIAIVFIICLYLNPIVTLVVSGIVVALAVFGIFVLPLLRPIPKIVPIPGKKTPDQIIVSHPWFTIESHCADHGVWWHTVDVCRTSYGEWKLQRNKAFGNFRILDPRHIRRSWGTQELMLRVFEELKKELHECEQHGGSPSK